MSYFSKPKLSVTVVTLIKSIFNFNCDRKSLNLEEKFAAFQKLTKTIRKYVKISENVKI
jgi:hypothetical protein